MNWPALSPRDRRTLAGGALVIGALLAVAVAVPRYRAWRSDSLAAARVAAAELVRAEQLVGDARATGVALAAARAGRVGLDTLLLQGHGVAAAGSALSDAVAESAEAAEVTLGSVLVSADTVSRARLMRFTARATATGDAASIARFLAVLETAPPLLVVREWSIAGGSMLAGPQPEVLRVDLEVEGVWAPPSRPVRR